MQSAGRFSVAGLLASSGWAVGMLIGLTWGQTLNWPDNIHVNYGAPITFATHTTSTIVGPVDQWILDLNALAVDILFWVVGIIVIFTGFLYLVRRTGREAGAPREDGRQRGPSEHGVGARSSVGSRRGAAASPPQDKEPKP